MAVNNLTIGVQYKPTNVVKDAATGKQTYLPVVLFYFNCDPQTANMVVASGVSKGLNVNGNSVVKKVKAEKIEDFIMKSEVFQKIIGEFEKYGYAYDLNNRDALLQEAQQQIDNYVQNGMQKQINADVSTFIDNLVDLMEKNLNDPNFQAFLHAVNIKKFMSGDDIDQLTDLKITNKIMALSQWINHGRQGTPKFIATAKQYRLAGYQVNPGATPMYIMGPHKDEVVGRSKSQVISDYGITDLASNDKRQIDVDRLSHDKDYGHNNAKKFQLWGPCYSILDCTNVANSNLEDYIDKLGDFSVNITTTDAKSQAQAQVQAKSDILSKFQMDNQNIISDSVMCQNAKKYADNIGDKKLAAVANNQSATDVIKFLVNNNEVYLRNKQQRYAQHSPQSLQLLEALAIKVMGLDATEADKVIAANAKSLRNNGKVNKDLFYSVAAELENIYFILKGISEAKSSSDMLMFVLNACGISVDEFRNMPENEQEANEMVSNVRENFIRTFNKLLITH